MVQGFIPALRRGNGDSQVFLNLILPDEIAQASRP
jgi:hypothetical protein